MIRDGSIYRELEKVPESKSSPEIYSREAKLISHQA